MKRADGQSLFLRFRHGSPSRIQMNIIEKISFFIEESKNDAEPLKYLGDLLYQLMMVWGEG